MSNLSENSVRYLTEYDNTFTKNIEVVNTVGGLTSGISLKNMTLKDIISKILISYKITNFRLLGSDGNTLSTNVNLSDTINYKKISFSLNMFDNTKYKILIDGKNILDSSINNGYIISTGNNEIYTVPNNTANITCPDTTRKVLVVLHLYDLNNTENELASATITINFIADYFYGFYAIDDAESITTEIMVNCMNGIDNKNQIKKVSKKSLSTGNNNLSYTNTELNQSVCPVFIYPSYYGKLTNVIDNNGFKQTWYPIYTDSSENVIPYEYKIDNVLYDRYYMYRAGTSTTISNASYTFTLGGK